jgi:exodeoxyribonuclease VII small subunit
MSDDRSTFEATRARLEDIVTQVRRKDVSLEQSLDMLEEAVRLVNQCNELIDQTSFRASATAAALDGETLQEAGAGSAGVQVRGTVDVGEDGIVEVDESIEFVSSEPGAEEGELAAEAGPDSSDAASNAEGVPDADDEGWGASDAWEAAGVEADAELEDDARE